MNYANKDIPELFYGRRWSVEYIANRLNSSESAVTNVLKGHNPDFDRPVLPLDKELMWKVAVNFRNCVENKNRDKIWRYEK